MEDRVRRWVEDNPHNSGDGYGSGLGSGFGAGDGYGAGFGYGAGAGSRSGYDYSSVDGSGYSSGCGFGRGYGVGFGSSDGYGDGYDTGYGPGTGYGISTFNGNPVYFIDGTPTVIRSVKGNIARGSILNDDFTETPCVIAKGSGCFAHGKTVREAVDALREKILSEMDTDEAIAEFVKHFAENKKYAGNEFFEWHHYLTGSCLAGREAFVRNHGINLDEEISVKEFIALCENDYGGEIISQLKEYYS